MSVRCAPLEKTTSLALIRSPGREAVEQLRVRHLVGHRHRRHEALISSCLTVTSLRGASSDCTWPCSVKVRCSGALLQPAARERQAEGQNAREAKRCERAYDLV